MSDDQAKFGEGRIWSRYNRHRYQILFFTLLFTLGAMPIATFFQWGSTAIELLFGAILLAAVMPLGTPRRRRMLIIAEEPFSRLLRPAPLLMRRAGELFLKTE